VLPFWQAIESVTK
jgi:hypothetical protein